MTTSLSANIPDENIGTHPGPSLPARTASVTIGVFAMLGAVFASYSVIIRAPMNWQYIVIALAFWITTVTASITYTSLIPQARTRMVTLSIVTELTLIVVTILVARTGLAIGVMIVLMHIVIGSVLPNRRVTDYIVTSGLILASLCILFNYYPPTQQVEILSLEIYIPSLVGIVIMAYITLLMMEYLTATIQIKLIIAALAIVLFPLIMLSVIETGFVQNALQNQTNQSLGQAAQQVAGAIDEFIVSNQTTIAQEAELPIFAQYLRVPANLRTGGATERQLALTLNSLMTKANSEYMSYGVLTIWGVNIYDTVPSQIGTLEAQNEYFVQAAQTGQIYTSDVLFSSRNNDGYIYFSSPVRDDAQNIVGVLRIRYDARVLQKILERYSNLLGKRSYPILIDENMMRLADIATPNQIYKTVTPLTAEIIKQLQDKQRLPNERSEALAGNNPELARALRNIDATPYLTFEAHPGNLPHAESGAIVTMQRMPWNVVYIQERSHFLELLQNQTRLSTTITIALAALIGLVAMLLARIFSGPIGQLTETAQRISAGDLEARAAVDSQDELGTLSNTFNIMTGRLRTFINELEDRVHARTRELADQNEVLRYRGRQLQTVSDVARGIVSSQKLEVFLTQVTQLISERFGFYHVGIFLLDENKEYAVLRAANSEGGQRMLARQHRLRVGQVGIVGYATAHGEGRIATDVGEDAVYFNNPDLPLTRSEMALPLKSGDQIIGALDVQSTESNAFTHDDIELFSTLADQVAIAITNNRLYAETARALEEMQRIHRQYLQQEWHSEMSGRPRPVYVYTHQGLFERQEVNETPEMQAALETGQPAINLGDDLQNSSMAVPIRLRGETIGIIHLQEKTIENREWDPEEVETVKAVADQVAQALENARLFEQTVRRAERERKVLEITSKIRSTNDPQQMLQIALEELKHSLRANRAQIILQANLPAQETVSPNASQDGQPDAVKNAPSPA